MQKLAVFALLCLFAAVAVLGHEHEKTFPDTSLLDALNAAIVRAKADGTQASTLTLFSEDPFFLPLDCSINPERHPYPEYVKGSHLAEVT